MAYELKTKLNDLSVDQFINSVTDDTKRADSQALLALMKEATGDEPKMWGANIIGFGSFTYKTKSGDKNEWMKVAFSPRKQNLTIYLMSGVDKFETEMKQLGKHKLGKGCLYINKLADVDQQVLQKIIRLSLIYLMESDFAVKE